MLVIQGAEMQTQLGGTLRVGYYAPAAPSFFPQITYKVLNENPRLQIKFIECYSLVSFPDIPAVELGDVRFAEAQ